MSDDNWSNVKFGDVVENVRRNIKNREEAGIEFVLGLDDIETGNLHVTGWKNIEAKPSFRTHFKPGQTLFGKRRAYLRKVAYAEFEGVCTQNILVFETKNPDILHPEFLPFICMSESFMKDAVKHSSGSLFPNANWKSIQSFEFALPPIETQRKLTEILWALDSVEIHYKKALECIHILMTKIRNVFVDHHGKESGFTRIEELCTTIRKGQSPRWQGFEYLDSGSPFITSENVRMGVLDNTKEKFVSEDFIQKLGYGVTETGDLLITIVGANIGNACLAPEGVRAGTNQAVAVLKPKKREFSPYLLECVLSRMTQNYFRGSGVTTAQPNISLTNIRDIKIPNASDEHKISLMNRISDLRRTDELLNASFSSIRDLRLSIINHIEEMVV